MAILDKSTLREAFEFFDKMKPPSNPKKRFIYCSPMEWEKVKHIAPETLQWKELQRVRGIIK